MRSLFVCAPVLLALVSIPTAPVSAVVGDEYLFVRADANDSGSIDIGDAQFIANWIFLGGQEPLCRDAADANDDGSVNMADVSAITNFLFLDGQSPPTPFPDCGTDLSPDGLGCQFSSNCPPASG